MPIRRDSSRSSPSDNLDSLWFGATDPSLNSRLLFTIGRASNNALFDPNADYKFPKFNAKEAAMLQ